MIRALAIAALVAAACGDRPVPRATDDAAPPPPRVDATPLLAAFECHRCHDGTGLPSVARERHCVGCHQDILAGTFEIGPDVLATWQQHIVSVPQVPSLAGARRLRRSWVRDHLLEPVDVRPGLPAMMPRLALTKADADALAAHLVPEELPPVTFAPDAAARGATLYAELGCASCHELTGATVAVGDAETFPGEGGAPQAPTLSARQLAPDLALARDRLQPAAVAAWILDPSAFDARSQMPAFAIPPADADALAAFIMTTPLAPRPRAPIPNRLPLLDRDVSYDEVEARVTHKICWHCHSQPDYARGDGGPGNTGGFGFAPRGLDLSSYEGIAAGALGDDGRRHSIFARDADGVPKIVRHLLARHAEVAGHPVPGIRGMPLGLPPLPLEDIQLLDSWIEQGRPR